MGLAADRSDALLQGVARAQVDQHSTEPVAGGVLFAPPTVDLVERPEGRSSQTSSKHFVERPADHREEHVVDRAAALAGSLEGSQRSKRRRAGVEHALARQGAI